jgi:DNA-binding CsgD family transcriptional regulator
MWFRQYGEINMTVQLNPNAASLLANAFGSSSFAYTNLISAAQTSSYFAGQLNALAANGGTINLGSAGKGTSAKIAADRGIKIGTVRAHLKTVFSKTHTRGQADLTRVLTRLSFLVPHSERKIAETQFFKQPCIPAAPDVLPGNDETFRIDHNRAG